MTDSADIASKRTPGPRDLPPRVIVGANGAYWRDYADDPLMRGYSMCPVSTDNDPIERVAVYVRVEDPPAPTDDEPATANGRDLLAHVVQYDPADADRKVVAAKIIAVENEARSEVANTYDELLAVAEALRRLEWLLPGWAEEPYLHCPVCGVGPPGTPHDPECWLWKPLAALDAASKENPDAE